MKRFLIIPIMLILLLPNCFALVNDTPVVTQGNQPINLGIGSTWHNQNAEIRCIQVSGATGKIIHSIQGTISWAVTNMTVTHPLIPNIVNAKIYITPINITSSDWSNNRILSTPCHFANGTNLTWASLQASSFKIATGWNYYLEECTGNIEIHYEDIDVYVPPGYQLTLAVSNDDSDQKNRYFNIYSSLWAYAS